MLSSHMLVNAWRVVTVNWRASLDRYKLMILSFFPCSWEERLLKTYKVGRTWTPSALEARSRGNNEGLRCPRTPRLWAAVNVLHSDETLMEAFESSVLFASLSLCQTLFTLSAGRAHSEGWRRIDLNPRRRGVSVAERQRLGRTARGAEAPDSPANPFILSLLSEDGDIRGNDGPVISEGRNP